MKEKLIIQIMQNTNECSDFHSVLLLRLNDALTGKPFPKQLYIIKAPCTQCYYWGSWRGGPNPISQQIVFFKSQLKSHNPSLCCSNWNPIPIFLLFLFHESQSQCTKSHFPAPKKGKSQLPFYPFMTLNSNTGCRVLLWCTAVSEKVFRLKRH